MAEKEQQHGNPLAPANGYTQSDQEAAPSGHSKELQHKKRMKYLLYVVIFAVFQIAIITLFALTIMKFRTPKFRVRSATFETLEAQSTTFNVRMNTELSIRNTNFGHFRYRNTTIDFYYRGTKVGEAFVQRARAKALSTRKLNVSVDLTSTNVTSDSQLGSDISSGTLPLTAQARLRGRITIMLIMKKKSGNMNCSMQLNIQTRQLQNLICK
ncbi:hypothetical protein LguiA_024142 [Lonicera macranthoides]